MEPWAFQNVDGLDCEFLVGHRFQAPQVLADMRVFNELLECVVFIGTEKHGPFSPVGTGFLTGYERDEYIYFFLVTANHVVDLVAGDKISIRMNRKDGTCGTIQLEKRFRIYSERDDLAVFHIPDLSSGFEVKTWPLDRKRRDYVHQNTYLPTVGDEVVTVGLYTSHYGKSKNIPVARIGNIAMLPSEPVRTDSGYVEAYLIEVRSIAGLSGSPVFLQIPRIRVENDTPQLLDHDISLLLGVMIGYHIVESKEDQIEVPQFQEFREAGAPQMTERNTGFAVVIPEDRLFELMESEEMSKRLDALVTEHFKKSGFRRAGASSAKAQAEPSDANPDHKEDFTSLLNAAAKGKPQAGQT